MLIDCLKRAGKALSKEDKDLLKSQYQKYLDDGLDELSASKRSLDDLVRLVDDDINSIARKIEDAGGSIKKPDDFEVMDINDAKSLAQEIAGRIIGTPDGRLPYDYQIGKDASKVFGEDKAGVFKKRSFTIPDDQIEEFLENDIETLAFRYVKSAAPDIELKKEFGSVDLKAEEKAILAEYMRLAEAESDPKKRQKIINRGLRDIQDLAAMRDRIRGQYKIPDANNPWVRAGRVARDLNYMRLLGGVVAASIPDVGRVVMAEGLTKTFKGFGKLAANLKTFRMAAEEAKKAGAGLDLLMSGRAELIADTMDYAKGGTKFERGVRSAADKFSQVNLMSYWTAGIKQFHGVMMQDSVIDGLLSGKIDKRLNQLGIDDGTAGAIAEQLGKHAKKIDGIWIANTDQWDSSTLVDLWRGAVRKESDRVIIVPGQEKPLFMSTEWGKTIFQFRTFMFSSTQRVLISSLQKQDKHTAQGLLSLVSLGMLSYAFKEWDAGRELSDDPKAWVMEGIDRSGALGILMEVNNTLEKASYNSAGLRPWLGITAPAGRYASRSVGESLLGPTLGSGLNTVTRIASGLTGEEGWTDADTRALRRLIPGQNLSFIRQLFDQLEQEL